MNSAPNSMADAEVEFRLVKMRPPIRSRASNTVTERPEPASLQAAASPEIPAPITMMLFASVIAFITGRLILMQNLVHAHRGASKVGRCASTASCSFAGCRGRFDPVSRFLQGVDRA